MELAPLVQSVQDIYKRIVKTNDKKALFELKKEIQSTLEEYEEWLVDNEDQ